MAGSPEKAGTEALAAARRATARNRCWPAAHRAAAHAAISTGDIGTAATELWRASSLYPMADEYRNELERLAELVTTRRETGP
jgi:hypothetical protein